MDIKKNETDFNVFDFISQNSLKMNFEDTPRDLVKEKKIWEDFIQPIIRDYELYRYGDTLFEYEETKEPSFFSSDDLEDMQRSVLFFTMELDWDAVYSPGEKKEYFFLDDVLKVLSRDVPKYAKGSLDPNIINLRDKLWEYLTVIFDSNDLPVFLEILSREPGAPKVIEPNQQHRPEYQNKEAVYQGSPTVSDSHLGKDISSEQALNDAISIVSEDVNRLYNGMKAFLKAKGLTLSKADENQQKEACQEFYSKDSDNFTYLELEHVEGAIDKLSYWGTNNSARDIKGGLFQQFISHEHSYLFADKNLNTNYQDLYSLSTKLQKNVLKQS